MAKIYIQGNKLPWLPRYSEKRRGVEALAITFNGPNINALRSLEHAKGASDWQKHPVPVDLFSVGMLSFAATHTSELWQTLSKRTIVEVKYARNNLVLFSVRCQVLLEFLKCNILRCVS